MTSEGRAEEYFNRVIEKNIRTQATEFLLNGIQ